MQVQFTRLKFRVESTRSFRQHQVAAWLASVALLACVLSNLPVPNSQARVLLSFFQREPACDPREDREKLLALIHGDD